MDSSKPPTHAIIPSQHPTLRDRYAMAALQGLLAGPPLVEAGGRRELAITAFHYADIMLRERDR